MGKKEAMDSMGFRAPVELSKVIEKLTDKLDVTFSEVVRGLLPPTRLIEDLLDVRGRDTLTFYQDLIQSAVRLQMLNDTEHPLAPALVKRYAGLGIFELYRDFVSAQQERPGYKFVESIKLGGVVRYLVTPPPVAKGAVYKNQRRTLRELFPEITEGQLDELMVKYRIKSVQEVEAKNLARRDKLRKENPEQAAAADKIIEAAEQDKK